MPGKESIMPSVVAGVASLFRGMGYLDDIVDTAKAGRAISGLVGGERGGGGDDVNLEKTRKLSAAIIEIASTFITANENDRKTLLADQTALKRVTEGYYGRLNPTDRDQYERVMGEVLGAICEGLGVRKPTQPQNQQGRQRNQQQGPAPQQPPDLLRDITEMQMFLAVHICIGQGAASATDEAAGDAIIKDGIERLRQASLGERTAAKTARGLGRLAEVLETINDELGH